ncbi:galactose-3-O-sulfotransferase 2 [Patella vulgata]|uniref:galactose-3-O-sulfotransferase 2 n=1 Tax=Patella vulgata TaxID=6465 RepID=UPI00217FD86E|nr:galactose-3-O-sulfotransferase 2 [Patella vulgata]XP_050411416.1 galactose-3-O-sulfotransferase 2 [Patella vulgata]XP_050411417.1 galactose-3-O-sulfotransferase 2 [Patella vulgata]
MERFLRKKSSWFLLCGVLVISVVAIRYRSKLQCCTCTNSPCASTNATPSRPKVPSAQKNALSARTNTPSARTTERCTTRRNNVAFLKVHKCGSTTMSNILHRFALRYNLNVILPNKNETTQFWVLGGLDNKINERIIPVSPGKNYNILAVETFFDKRMFQTLIPNDPFILGILREPVERQASYVFYNKNIRIKLEKKMKTDPYIFRSYPSSAPHMLRDYNFYGSRLGIDKFIEKMDNEFDMIMLTEYFDESLILLKRKLCWTFKDIVYMTVNKNFKNKGYAVSPADREKVLNTYKNDSMFYEHFKGNFFGEMGKNGVGFLHELHQFKLVLKLVRDYCTFVKKGDKSLVIPKSSWNERFLVDPNECRLMQLIEFPLVRLLQKRQWQLYADSSQK